LELGTRKLILRFDFVRIIFFNRLLFMRVADVVEILGANVICGSDKLEKQIEVCFASDLMSDVLTLDTRGLLLLTGLANLQTIRTAEMSDIIYVVFVRNKKASDEMVELAREIGMVLIESPYSLYKASGLLYTAGLKPVY
jgi:hypothetical protein